MVNYNRPKVAEEPLSRREVLPLPTATLVSAAGYMLENPGVSIWYFYLCHT